MRILVNMVFTTWRLPRTGRSTHDRRQRTRSPPPTTGPAVPTLRRTRPRLRLTDLAPRTAVLLEMRRRPRGRPRCRGVTTLSNAAAPTAVSLHYMHYNFARPHKTLTKAAGGYPTTPAMAAGVADHVWTLTEIAALLD